MTGNLIKISHYKMKGGYTIYIPLLMSRKTEHILPKFKLEIPYFSVN